VALEAAASALAPARPGLLVPSGTIDGLSRARSVDVLRALADLRQGRRLQVGWVGSFPVDEVVAELSPALAALEPGRPGEALEPGTTDALVVRNLEDAEPTQVVIGWAARTTEPSAGGGSAFTESIVRRLARAGFAVVSRSHGIAEGLVWSAVAVRVADAELDEAPARIVAATAGARLPAGMAEQTFLAGRLAEASPVLSARRLAAGRALDSIDAIHGTFEALTASAPVIAVLRPQPDAVLRAGGAR
jgi:hypothetical protein